MRGKYVRNKILVYLERNINKKIKKKKIRELVRLRIKDMLKKKRKIN